MKILFLSFTLLFSLLLSNELLAQSRPGARPVVRCATMQRVEKILQNKQVLTGANVRTRTSAGSPVLSTFRLTAVVTVPVVVHIVLPNPFIVTDADVQAQIDRLNLDFSGLNPDSTNAPSQFLAVRGHTQIRFCLAKRTPAGQLTSGIERKASTTGFDPYADQDPIKYASLGGLDQWDPNSYLNLWVGADNSGSDILGYAQFPASDPVLEDGVVISYQSWASNSCYTIPDYNRGRTATHEVGHYFGLLHIWGDDDGCEGDDFRNLAELNSTCNMPPGLYNLPGQGNTASDVGDTPNQGSQTENCPGGTATDACATSAPGKMYQNHMDYSFDACLTMFTKKQAERMEWVLDNCRSGLQTSQGCQPPASAVTRDAAPLQSVNPGGFELEGCNTRTYSSVIFCPGAFTPKLRIINNAASTLTTVTAGYRLDNGAPVTQTVNVNLGLGATTVVSLPAVSLTAGTHEFKFFTANPNGAADQVPVNDTLTITFTVSGTASVPFREDFTGTSFPPPNWTIINPDGGITWERHTTGNGTAGSAYINTFNYVTNDEKDDLVTPRISYSAVNIDSVKLTFDVASATYTDIDDPVNAGVPLDTLEILVSKDCGNSFTTVYKKWGKDLRTVDTPQEDEFFPTSTQWRRDTADLSAFANQSPIQLFFRVTNNYENNLFIDNVMVTTSEAPAALKDQGYLFLPNPFRESFYVWHYKQPVGLRFIRVYNSVGQVVFTRQFNGNADNFMTVNLYGKAAGVYIIRMEYADGKTVSDQILKY
ncbi:MAG TPA: choice-of-anchor J domain-containing protein [Flavisolibacter sp.]|nr:choice-of-anchor J domain-containing protein [Flavisolibacter sp.]